MKYPIGIQTFEQIRDGGFVYVDKTDQVYDMAENGKIYFLSRPRRFGKSLLLSTLRCYFEGKHNYFKGLKIDSLEKDWKKYPVFTIDFKGNIFTNGNELVKSLDGYVKSWERQYGKDPDHETLGDRFAYVLHEAHNKTGLPCVVLVDEYDKPILDVLDTRLRVKVGENDMLIEDYNRDILKGFFSVFKKADADLRFVFLTGVTKFSQVSVFSGFNQPNDISMSRKYEAICGITQEELDKIFDKQIEELAEELSFTKDKTKRLLKQFYDGYHFSSGMTDIYNPFSILNALSKKDLQDYWFQSGTPSYLIRLLNHTRENLNEITGKYYSAQQFIDYKANIEAPLPMIYQSGYLTIKNVRRRGNGATSYLLDFPNNEVKEGFLTMVANNYLKSEEDSTSWLNQAVDALAYGKPDTFRSLLTSFLASIPYSVRRKKGEKEKERYFQYTVYLLMRMISCYTIFHEKETSKGRADCVIETDDYIYIFEYKLDKTADEAIKQIDEKGYADEYKNDPRTAYKIGCSFSSKTGTISDWKEVPINKG